PGVCRNRGNPARQSDEGASICHSHSAQPAPLIRRRPGKTRCLPAPGSGQTLANLSHPKPGCFGGWRRYHLMIPFCHTSMRSRALKSKVMTLEKNAAMMINAAYTLPYSAQPCAQLTYQPRPDFTPTDSAT